MKKIVQKNKLGLAVLLISIFSITLVNNVTAGGSRSYRANCVPINKKYKTFGAVFHYGLPYHQSQQGNCTQAISQYSEPHANFNVRAGVNDNYTLRWNDRWWATAGLGYTPPAEAPKDSIGYSIVSFSDNVEFTKIEGAKGSIKLTDISGFLKSYKNSNFGSTYRILIWLPDNLGDAENDEDQIKKTNILWEAGVYINNGKLETTGNFKESYFTQRTTKNTFVNSITNEKIKGDAIQVTAKALALNIDIQTDIIDKLLQNPGNITQEQISNINLDNIVVTIIAHGGYGEYNDPYGYNTAYNTKLETLSVETSQNNLNAANFNFSVFPNPTNSILNINVNGNSTNFSNIEILDVDGVLVKTIPIDATNPQQNSPINVSELIEGQYYLIIEVNGNAYSKTFYKTQ